VPAEEGPRGEGVPVYSRDGSFAQSEGLLAPGAGRFAPPGRAPKALKRNAALLRVVNVDSFGAKHPPGPLAEPTRFERKWLRGRLYRRWLHVGTVYGFSPHSGALLAAPCDEPPIFDHFFDMYFDQTVLLLYLRSTTFGFSRELAQMSALAADALDQPGQRQAQKRLKENFQSLRYAFALFTNMYQFPLLSSQQQGVEMYAIQRKALDIDELFREVKEEIETTDEYLGGVEQSEQSWMAALLNMVAFVGLGVSLLLGPLQFEPSGAADLSPDLRHYGASLWAYAGNLLLGFLSLMLLISPLWSSRIRRWAERRFSDMRSRETSKL